jgi:transcriptional regulator with XRE-family HTH domain
VTHEQQAAKVCATWGANIERYRRDAGLSQSALAALLGVSQQQVSTWEQGTGEPRLATRLALSEALGVASTVLFPGP